MTTAEMVMTMTEVVKLVETLAELGVVLLLPLVPPLPAPPLLPSEG